MIKISQKIARHRFWEEKSMYLRFLDEISLIHGFTEQIWENLRRQRAVLFPLFRWILEPQKGPPQIHPNRDEIWLKSVWPNIFDVSQLRQCCMKWVLNAKFKGSGKFKFSYIYLIIMYLHLCVWICCVCQSKCPFRRKINNLGVLKQCILYIKSIQ